MKFWQPKKKEKIANSVTPRTRAYFYAYRELVGDKIPATGISLTDGFLYLDKTAMKILLRHGWVNFEEAPPQFKVTSLAGEIPT